MEKSDSNIGLFFITQMQQISIKKAITNLTL